MMRRAPFPISHFPFSLLLAAVCLVNEGLAAPRITGWWNSKTGDAKTMFLAQEGEKVTFRAEVEAATAFEWTVNKEAANAPAGKGEFEWTTPNAKGIWEIHTTAKGADGETHHEWVVSTLTNEEAPTFFDSFTDKRYTQRTETDPWGRKLPEWGPWAISADWTEWQELWRFLPGSEWGKWQGEWTKKLSVLDASSGFVQAPSEAPEPNYPRHLLTLLSAKTGIEFGSWKFRFRFPNGRAAMQGGKTHLRFYFAHANGYYWYPFWYGVACDGFNALRVGGSVFDESAGFPVDTRWHEVTLIRTPENEVYSSVDGLFQYRGKTARRTYKDEVTLKIGLARFQPDHYPKDTVHVDGIEVYEKKYLFPPPRAHLAEVGEGAAKGRTIVVSGREARLQTIADAVKGPALFRYDAASGEALCAASLLVSSGADLLLSGETLRFGDSQDAPYALRVGPSASLHADKSSIRSGSVVLNRPFDLRFTDVRVEPRNTFLLSLPALAMGKWEFNRAVFTGEGAPAEAQFVLSGNETRLNLYNVRFGATTVTAQAATKCSSVLGLVNCKFDKLSAAEGASLAPKYYLDVCVLDAQKRPVPGGKVTVRNEVDDLNFPAENWQEFQPSGGGETAYLNESVLPRLISYTTKRSTFTGPEGHTPLPEDRENSLIIADFVQQAQGQKHFTYSIEAISPSGQHGKATRVNPDATWFRDDPGKPTVTVIVTVRK